MFLEAAVLGLVIGFLRGGGLGRLGQIDLRGWPLAAIALLIQAGLWADFKPHWHYQGELTPYLHLFSYLPLLLFVYINRKQPGMHIIGLGLLLNLLAIAANGGVMPVNIDKLVPLIREELLNGTGSPLHRAINSTTKLAFLGDIIRIPYGKYKMISIGDILLAIGLFHFIQQGMQKRTSAGRKRGRKKT